MSLHQINKRPDFSCNAIRRKPSQYTTPQLGSRYIKPEIFPVLLSKPAVHDSHVRGSCPQQQLLIFFSFPPTISANRKQSETGWITRIQSTGLELVAEPVLRWQRRSEPVDRLSACVGGNAERQPRKRRSRRGWSGWSSWSSSCSTGYRIWADTSALNAVFPGTESSWNHKSHQCATKKITRAAEQRPAFDICDVWSLNLGWNFNYKSRTRLSNCFVLERWEIARESQLI